MYSKGDPESYELAQYTVVLQGTLMKTFIDGNIIRRILLRGSANSGFAGNTPFGLLD